MTTWFSEMPLFASALQAMSKRATSAKVSLIITLECHSNCHLCVDTTNINCPACSSSAFLLGGNECVSSCPYGYLEDSAEGLCHFDTSTLLDPVDNTDVLNEGCSQSQYYSAGCFDCHSDCLTCTSWMATDCTSCPLGTYLSSGSCLTCDAIYMVLGSSGQCVENCGSGVNFGLKECDDGNIISGDGCSSSCEVEEGWVCQGGS